MLARVGDAGTLAARSLNPQSVVGLNQFHLSTLPPPLVHFHWSRGPDPSLFPELRDIGKQVSIDRLFAWPNNVVGVDDEVRQPVLLQDEIDLPLP